ncbi:unnamed protein product [Peniophora sp. CBMAI 1063]|nr:unnamed protein product [Peniophora sp. CBMAI 1063]
MSDYKLTILTVPKLSELPSEETALGAAHALMADTEKWKKGKKFDHGHVQTYSRAKGAGDGAGWHCRVSEHGPEDASFDEFWKNLGIEHSVREKEYIKEVKKATLIKQISPEQAIWSMYYEFSTLGVSSRVFTALQIAHLETEDGRRTGYFIQIPVDLAEDSELAKKEEKGVKGRYVSVERLKELENGKVEWRMATSSSPGGSLPSFLVESTMAGQISADVPHFLTWLKSTRSKDEPAAPQPAEPIPIPSEEHAAGPLAETDATDAVKASVSVPDAGGVPAAA